MLLVSPVQVELGGCRIFTGFGGKVRSRGSPIVEMHNASLTPVGLRVVMDPPS